MRLDPFTGHGCLGILIFGFLGFMVFSLFLGCGFDAACWDRISH